MNYCRSITFLLALAPFWIFASDAASVTMNKCKHPDGRIEFTDRPCPADALSSSIENNVPAQESSNSKKKSIDTTPLDINNRTEKVSISSPQQNSQQIIAPNKTDGVVLISAVRDGDCDKVQAILKAGESPNTRYEDFPSRQETPIIFLAINKENLCVVNALVSTGADVNYINRIKGNTPGLPTEYTPLSFAIMVSVRINKIALVDVLMKYNARPDLKASDGTTFVQHAIDSLTVSAKNNVEKMKILKEIERKLAL